MLFYTFYAVTLLEPGIYSGIERKNAALEKSFPMSQEEFVQRRTLERLQNKLLPALILIVGISKIWYPWRGYNKFGAALSSSELTSSQEVIILLINAPFVLTLNVFDFFWCLVRVKIMVSMDIIFNLTSYWILKTREKLGQEAQLVFVHTSMFYLRKLKLKMTSKKLGWPDFCQTG